MRRSRISRRRSRKPEPSSPRTPQLSADLAEIVDVAADELRRFARARIFVTGGTGFVGTWLLWSVIEANRLLGTHISIDVLSRDPDEFAQREPEIASSAGIRLVRGDVTGQLPTQIRYDAIVHAATPASAALLQKSPQEMLDVILRGSSNVAELTDRCGPITVFFTSSGAVYGRQPESMELIDETYTGGPDPTNPSAAYQEGKRCGELMCAIAAERSGGRAILARLFAFVGPYLPLDRHFAIGNFIRNRLHGQPIRVGGDGTAVRSYLYATDMTTWIWCAFARGESRRAYNIGSEASMTIAELSRHISGIEDPILEATIAQVPHPENAPDRYVPSTRRIRTELGVRQLVAFDDAVRRTLRYHRECMSA